MPSLMDQTETCIGHSKFGLVGVPCGHNHSSGHWCLFDLTYPSRLCASYPKCRKRLRKRPTHNIPGRLYIYEDIVVVRW